MEINIKDNLYKEKIQKVPLEKCYRHEVVDITVKCPKCGLEYTEYDNNDDELHYIECDRCGTIYKYRYGVYVGGVLSESKSICGR